LVSSVPSSVLYHDQAHNIPTVQTTTAPFSGEFCFSTVAYGLIRPLHHSQPIATFPILRSILGKLAKAHRGYPEYRGGNHWWDSRDL